jgi:glycosyltransferase involved in cell wall biosynthesis
MTKVLIDGYFLQKPYGFGRYIYELCRALGLFSSGIDFIVAVPSRIDPRTLPQHSSIQWHSVPDANFIIWEQFTMPRLARALRCELIHFPYNTKALRTRDVPTVVTVHDLMFLDEHKPLRRPKDFIASRYSKFVFRNGTAQLKRHRGDAVIAVSNTTRVALEASAIEATTVFNTVDGFVADFMLETKPQASRPYFFHRGGFAEHRNTGRVIEAFKLARHRMGDTVLKIVGAPGGAEMWNTQNDNSVQFLPRISDSELASVYQGCVAVVATSLLEGFGLPVIEGFGFGAPVITSTVNPLAEVAGGAALLVSPTSASEIADAMVSLRQNEPLRQDLIARGDVRKQLFSSAQMADGMMTVYRMALTATPA